MKIKKISLFFLLYILFNTPHCFGYISDRNIVFYIKIIVGLFLTIYVLKTNYKKFDSSLKIGIKIFIIPYFLVTFLSFITGMYIYHLNIKPYISQSFLLFITQWIVFLVAYYIYINLKEEALELVIKTGIISYTTVVFKYIFIGGIDAILHPFNYRINGVGLEVHSLTYTFILILLYQFMVKNNKDIFKNKMLYIVIFYIVLGNKRAGYLGFVITIFLYFFISIFKRNKKMVIKLIMILLVLSLIASIIFIHSGYLQFLAIKLNLEDSFRFNFWNYFRNYYVVSPLYFGRTLFFTDYYMTLPEIHKMYNFGGQGQIHNDILRTYIGWGFIPFLYYYMSLIFGSMREFKKKKREYISWKFLLIICFFVIIEEFDNMLGTIDFNMLVYFLFFLLINDYKENFNVKRNIK